MTYQRTRSPMRRRPMPMRRKPAPAGLGGIFDLIDPFGILHDTHPHVPGHENCEQFADNARASMQVYIEDVAKNWSIDGPIEPADMLKAIKVAQDMLASGSAALDHAFSVIPANDTEGRSLIQNERDEIQRKFHEGLPFIDTAKEAIAQSAVVDSSGLKDYVINSMQAGRDAVRASALLACEQPEWVAGFVSFMRDLEAVANAVKAIGKAIVKAGEVILKVPDIAFDIMKYVPIVAVLGGAYWIYTIIQDNRRRGA